jgi:protein-tyrosine phosphatase
MKSILVVCEGNICRSPMAEAILTAALPDTRIHSAGLNALVGNPADDNAIRLMRLRGLDISHHRAVQMNRELCLRSELVLVMSTEQRKQVEETYPTSNGRVYRIGEFDKIDVPDPFNQSIAVFETALKLIDQGVRSWLQRIRQI